MTDTLGTTGLILNEPLLWEKGRKGRCGYSLPRRDVPVSSLDPDLTGSGPDFPDLSEVDLVRHRVPQPGERLWEHHASSVPHHLQRG